MGNETYQNDPFLCGTSNHRMGYTLPMKALVIDRLGAPEVLAVQEVADPAPDPGQELIQVEAGGINFADIMTMQGGYPGAPKPPLIAGREFSGNRAGDGQRVMGYVQWGAFAEQVAASKALLWPVPQAWSAEEGAAFPVNYFTAYFAYWKAGLMQNLSAATYVRPPEDLDDLLASIGAKQNSKPQTPRVLIHAVAGGVGTAAVQIGKLLGIEMYGTSSSEDKLSRMKALGLQHGINYKERDYEEAIKQMTRGEGVDAVFEMLGGEHTTKSVHCLRDFGRVIVYGAATGQPATVDARQLYAKGASVHGLWLTYLSAKRELMNQAWQQLSAWMAQGHLRPVIGSVLPLEKSSGCISLINRAKKLRQSSA